MTRDDVLKYYYLLGQLPDSTIRVIKISVGITNMIEGDVREMLGIELVRENISYRFIPTMIRSKFDNTKPANVGVVYESEVESQNHLDYINSHPDIQSELKGWIIPTIRQ